VQVALRGHGIAPAPAASKITMESRMTCRQLIDALADYTAPTLDVGERERCDRHLANCPRCVAYLRGYLETIRLTKVGAAARTDAAEPMPADLVDAILAATTRRAR
jgi:anti-sigma factor RsiW